MFLLTFQKMQPKTQKLLQSLRFATGLQQRYFQVFTCRFDFYGKPINNNQSRIKFKFTYYNMMY